MPKGDRLQFERPPKEYQLQGIANCRKFLGLEESFQPATDWDARQLLFHLKARVVYLKGQKRKTKKKKR